MGLLDDAIREHLELKRRRGADPGEIAHQEQAALAPVFPPEETAAGAAAAAETEAAANAHEPPLEPALAADMAVQAPGEGVDPGDETAEIDMRAVLDGEDVNPVSAPGDDEAGREPVAARAPRVEPAGVLEDDALAWEMPGEETGEEGLTPEIPGQERMSFE